MGISPSVGIGGVGIGGTGITPYAGITALSLLPQTQAIIAAFTTPPTAARAALINTAVAAMIASGVWAKLDVLWLFAAADEQAGRINWKNPGTSTATAVNSPVFTANQGFASNGTSSYIDSNFNPVTQGVNFTQNAASFAVWSRTSGATGGSSSGWYDGTDGVTMLPRDGTNASTVRVNQATASSTAVGSVLDGSGLFVGNRSDGTTIQLYRSSVALTLTVNPIPASAAMNSANFRFGNALTGGFVAMQFAAGFCGGNLVAGEQTAIYAALLAYLQGVGAA